MHLINIFIITIPSINTSIVSTSIPITTVSHDEWLILSLMVSGNKRFFPSHMFNNVGFILSPITGFDEYFFIFRFWGGCETIYANKKKEAWQKLHWIKGWNKYVWIWYSSHNCSHSIPKIALYIQFLRQIDTKARTYFFIPCWNCLLLQYL